MPNAHDAGGDVTALVDLLRHEKIRSRWPQVASQHLFDMEALPRIRTDGRRVGAGVESIADLAEVVF